MMAWADGDPWDDIKAQHPLLEVVQQHVKMKKAGPEWVGLCPFHGEKTPSFFVNPAKEKYNCQGCGAHGDVLDFVQGLRSCTKAEAIAELTGGKVSALPEPVRKERDRLRTDAEMEEARRRAEGTREAAKRWLRATRVDTSHPYLVRKGIAEIVDDLHLARAEDRAVLVPIYDPDGEIQTVQRIMPEEGAKKKFADNAPAKMGRLLIGLSFGGRVIVCEGFATGVSIYASWPEQVCVAFSGGNMETVARDFHARGVPILLAPDKDKMAHFAEVAKELDCPIIGPEVDGPKADFNDQFVAHGAAAVLKTFMDGLREYSTRAERERKDAEQEAAPFDLWAKAPVPPFPEFMLPPLISRFARIRADMIGCDPSGLAMTALATCGALIRDGIKLKMKRHDDRWKESARLWVMLVGDPSTKKSPILSGATHRLAEMDRELSHEYERLARDWEEDGKKGAPPVPRRLRISDITMEAAAEVCANNPDGVLSLQDELSGWFGGIEKYSGGKGGAKDRSFWLQAFNGGHYATDRVGRKASFVDNLSISMVGGVQPDPIRRVMQDASDDGLIQRFLPVMLGRPVMGKDIEMPDVASEYDALLDALHALNPPETWCGAQPLVFDDAAQDLRNELEAKHLAMMLSFDGINRKIASHIGKYDGIFGRLCVIFHCIECVSEAPGEPLRPEVGFATAKRAADFLHRFLRPQALAFYTDVVGASDDHGIITDVAGYIIAKGLERVSHRTAQLGTRAMRKLTKADTYAIFEQMDAYGWLIEDTKRADARAWMVNPAVHILFADRASGEREQRAAARSHVANMLSGAE